MLVESVAERVNASETSGAGRTLLGGWQPTPRQRVQVVFRQKDLPPFFKAALDFTAFGLDQFKARADHDGMSLVILSTHTMKPLFFDRLNALATARGIPVIDQADYIRRQGFKVKEARWERDNLYRLQAGGAFHAVEKMPLLK